MKIIFRAITLMATVVTVFLSTPIQAGEQKGKIANTPRVAEFISSAKKKINDCEGKYQDFLALSFANEKAWESEYNLNQALAKAGGGPVKSPKMEHAEPYHKTCAEAAKQETIPNAKIFIKSFKTASAQKNAKDMIAQWITAIDSIGNDGAKAEAAKFETLANGLMLEL